MPGEPSNRAMPRAGAVVDPRAGAVPSVATLRQLLQEGAVSAALANAEGFRADPGFGSLKALHQATILTAIVECRLARGDLVQAIAAGDELGEYLVDAGPTAAAAYYGKATLAAALGDPHQAVGWFTAAGEQVPNLPLVAARLPWRVGASLALLHTRTGGAAALAAEHLDLVTASGSTPAIGLALRTTAACDSGGRRVDLLRDALAAVDGVTAHRLTAQIATDLAEMLALTHDPTTRAETLELLRGAEVYAGREQLWPLRARVRRVLDRLGEQAAPLPAERLLSLTRTERRIAALAAEGRTNRQVADVLDVGVKNVEWHLSRTYRKLGIRSRTGLAPLFASAV